jgi:signal transduction histidine kinase
MSVEARMALLQDFLHLPVGNLKATLMKVADQLNEAFAAEKVDAFLFDPETDSLVAVGTSDTPLGRKQHALGLHRLALSNGGQDVRVYREQRELIDGRVDEDPTELAGIREALGVRSHLAVPLRVGGELRGVLSVTSTEPERFTPEDLRLLGAVADWVGAVAHRAELTEALARQSAEEGRRAAAEELVTTLAHDLGNYLGPMRLHLGLILERALRDGRTPDVRGATAASDALARLTRLTSDLLDVGRLERGLFALSARPVELVALAVGCASIFAGPGVDVQVKGETEVYLAADPDRLQQALENLLGNAVKHAPRGTPVVMELATAALAGGRPAVAVHVSDAGPGIPPELLSRIFERFVTGPTSSGLGLGLYLAQRIATAHGGTLTVESRLGEGTRFTLTLPLEGPPSLPGGTSAR